MVFNRGSGQNKLSSTPSNVFTDTFKDAEPESHSFFSQFKTHLDVEYPHLIYKAVSVHDFPGKYDPVGYKAVGVGLLNADNLANSEVSMIPGDYRESVDHGVAETVGYLKDQISSCPNQSIIIGGYSQGAQVVGDALPQLTSQERAKILGVGLVGDPKFIAAHGDSLANPFDHAVSYPWRRGDATNHDQGMLEPRVPYVPQDLENRTVSYCYRTDIICSGWSGVNKDFRQVHSSYAAEPMRNNVNELMQWAAPTLANAERAEGGLGSSTAGTGPANFDASPKDVMFLLNDDAMANALYSFRYDTDLVISGVSGTYPNVNFAAKGFGETDDGETYIPRVDNIQSFQPYAGYDPRNPTFSTSNLYNSFANRYPFGNQAMGSGDWPDPHGLAVEKAAFSGGWRPEAQKHIVLVTDRPPKTDYSYNICDGTVRSWLHVANTNGYDACFTNGGTTDIWPKVQHSEFCQTIYLAVTGDNCKNSISKPGYVQMVSRSLNDAIVAAQSQHISVDVVIPNVVTNQYFPQLVPKMVSDLQYLAKSTGGVFMYYDQRSKFDKATYSDTMYQVLGHKPEDIVIAYKEALDTKNSFNSGQVLVAHTNQPVILDASNSNKHFSSYNWDFNNDGQWDDVSPGPVVEHTFTSPQTSFVRVAGVTNSGAVEAETHLAVNIALADPPQEGTLPSVPDVIAAANADGSTRLAWQVSGEGSLIISDPETGIPLTSALMSDGIFTIPIGQSLTSLSIRATTETGTSDPVTIQVAPLPPPLVVTDDPGPDNQSQEEIPPLQEPEDQPPVDQESTQDPSAISEQEPEAQPEPDTPQTKGQALETIPDPTLCYKLQQCNRESDPNNTVQPTASTIVHIGSHNRVSISNTPQGVVAGASTMADFSTPYTQPQGTYPEPQQLHHTYIPLKQILLLLIICLLAWLYIRRYRRHK